jgi:omega-amidase
MRVYCCQLDIAWEDKPANYAKTRALLDALTLPRGSLVLLPEMFATGFSMDVAAIAEEEGGETEAFLARTACEYGIYLLGGAVTAAPDGRGHNEAVVFSPEGERFARYRKIHPFTYGGETRHYAPGRQVVPFEWRSVTVSPFICYDLRFPEVFRSAVRQGAQLFTVIANWPAARESHWVALLKARAIENQAYVAGVNRCGRDPKLAYSGRSMIISPRGDVLTDAGETEGVASADLDLAALLEYRRSFPALADMREEYLGL